MSFSTQNRKKENPESHFQSTTKSSTLQNGLFTGDTARCWFFLKYFKLKARPVFKRIVWQVWKNYWVGNL